jgi:hypothetical protein
VILQLQLEAEYLTCIVINQNPVMVASQSIVDSDFLVKGKTVWKDTPHISFDISLGLGRGITLS